MVLVTLTLMLFLSAVISVNAVQPVLDVFAVFSALYAVGVLVCVLPRYARSRGDRPRDRRPATARLVISRASPR
jgi:hypothetical protein